MHLSFMQLQDQVYDPIHLHCCLSMQDMFRKLNFRVCVWVVHFLNMFSINCSSCLTPKMIMLSTDLILEQHPCYIIDMMFQVV